MAKILLIDDDSSLRGFLQGALEDRGHNVACLERAEGGVDLLATGEFDFVLVDEHMPGLSGSDFLKVLHKKGFGIPAILMTGYAQRNIRPAVKGLDVVVVGKPSGGNEEFWKELEPLLANALQGDGEVLTFLRRAIDVALKAGKTELAPRLRKLLDQELLRRVLSFTDGDQTEAARIAGVPLADLLQDDPSSVDSKEGSLLSLQVRALLLIHNHPEWTVAEIAHHLGCSKAKLYRYPIINRALRSRRVGPRSPKRGYIDTDGTVDAIDE